MKIVVITSSAHVNGASTYLADQFIEGATDGYNDIYHYNAVDHQNNFVMVDEDNQAISQHDDIDHLLDKIKAADLMVMVTPLYYFGMSSLLKTIVDRFYDYNNELRGNKQAVMIATGAGSVNTAFDSLKIHYKQIIDYMHWIDAGAIWDLKALAHPAIDRYGQEAFKLGQKFTAGN